MSYSAKVLWGEGLFLRPQHFQRQDAYHEARLFESIQAIQPYNWGVRSVRIDRDALGSNVLRVAELALVFPGGAAYSAPSGNTSASSATRSTLLPSASRSMRTERTPQLYGWIAWMDSNRRASW